MLLLPVVSCNGLYHCSASNIFLHTVESILRDPEHALCGELKRLPHGHWRFRSLAHKTDEQKRKLFCSHCSSTPQQDMISHLNCLSHSVWFYQGSCPIRIAE